ncbi:MAG: CDP-alcohol phosphatidyltransferase family protein [Thermoplasmata archaeon]|nr:CDP-alcohol phosphatidyltransferase family protein [Thermoplasmata archaeon]
MTDRWRVGANLATLANALLGVGAILYVLAGNKLWAMLLIAAAIGFDGLDGLLSRRSTMPPSSFGRYADSVADAITFGLAPAFLIAVHTSNPGIWAPWETVALALAAAYFAAAIGRLVYFTARGFQNAYFLGVPTPQAALALIVALLFHDTPAFQTVQPVAVLIGAAVIAVLMVVPIPYPKIRRGSILRAPMAATGIATVVAILVLQFHPATGSALFLLALGASYSMLIGVATYYFLGPFTVDRRATPKAAS